MKTLICALALMLGLTSAATADTVTREGTYGTSVTTRSLQNGTWQTDGTWTGTSGGVYSRGTTCADARCATAWTYTGPNDRVTSGERRTRWGIDGSRTEARVTGPAGRTRSRLIQRWR